MIEVTIAPIAEAVDSPGSRVFQLLLLALLVLASCGDPADAPTQAKNSIPKTSGTTPDASTETEKRQEITEAEAAASHARMLQELSRIAERMEATNPFFGDGPLRLIESRLADPKAVPEIERIQMLIEKSQHELRLGYNEEAVSTAEEAYLLLLRQSPETIRNNEADCVLGVGLTHLRAAEVANCVGQHNRDSCILPIQGGGVHQDKSGSTKAKQYFLRALELSPKGTRTAATALWLLNVTAMTLGEYPAKLPGEYRIPPESFGLDNICPRFPNISNEIGLATRNLSGGVVIDDLDGDDDLDILTSTWDPTGNVHYFRNDGKDGFHEITAEAGLEGILGGLNMIHADYDNDGDVDIVILRGAWMMAEGCQPNSLLRNRGDGTFEDVAYAAGIAGVDFPTQTGAFADYDNDGDLDLYFGNESTPPQRSPSQLFRNEGDGTFKDVAGEAGVENLRYAKGAAWGDIDSDGFIDLFVSNLNGKNRLYRNGGNGSFVDIAERAGVQEPNFSFPCWFFDFDNDGHLDIYVAAYVQDIVTNALAYMGVPSGVHGHLYRGRGDGTFMDVSKACGLDRLVTTMGANFGDLDNDGFLDFYLGTGFPAYEGLLPNVMYRNAGGRAFFDVTRSGGFGHLQKGHAIAFADLDSDGDQDVFEQLGGAFPGDSFMDALFVNPGFENGRVTLHLVGRKANRSAIGARVTVVVQEGGKRKRFHRQVGAQGSFGSAPLRLHVGLGKAREIRRVEVLWPGKTEPQIVKNLKVDRAYRIIEGEEQAELIELQPFVF